MKKIYSLLCSALLVVSPFAAAQYNQVFVLGDSYSDQGNSLSLGGSNSEPPYLSGRFSNGRVTVELIAESLGVDLEHSNHLVGSATGTNFAVGGATALGSTQGSLSTQLTAMLASQNNVLPSDALYIVYIGSNDVINASFASNPENTVDQAADAVMQTVDTMINAGATRFLVVGIPDIGQTPAYLESSSLSTYSKRFNNRIRRNMRMLRQNYSGSDLLIAYRQIFSWLRTTTIHKSNQLGFSSLTEACLEYDFNTNSFVQTPECDLDTYMFFDAVHFTAEGHKRAADFLKPFVPLP